MVARVIWLYVHCSHFRNVLIREEDPILEPNFSDIKEELCPNCLQNSEGQSQDSSLSGPGEAAELRRRKVRLIFLELGKMQDLQRIGVEELKKEDTESMKEAVRDIVRQERTLSQDLGGLLEAKPADMDSQLDALVDDLRY
jgi:hypothetical protein